MPPDAAAWVQAVRSAQKLIIDFRAGAASSLSALFPPSPPQSSCADVPSSVAVVLFSGPESLDFLRRASFGPRVLIWPWPLFDDDADLGPFGPILKWLMWALSQIPDCNHAGLFFSASRPLLVEGPTGGFEPSWRFVAFLATLAAFAETRVPAGFALESAPLPPAA